MVARWNNLRIVENERCRMHLVFSKLPGGTMNAIMNLLTQLAAVFTISKWTWWSRAVRKPAHRGRVGPPIKPWCVVLHTTDMLPGTFDAIVKSWTTTAGVGQCANFLIGRIPEQGVVQFISIDRNSNHAGGPTHGWFVVDGKKVHPNSVSVSIEIHNAGQLRLVDGEWRSWDYQHKQPQGDPFDPADVEVDQHRPTRGWHRLTQYQHDTLTALLADLEAVLAPMPASVAIESNGPQTNQWAKVANCRIVGHVTLDPERKTDPGPEVMREFAR